MSRVERVSACCREGGPLLSVSPMLVPSLSLVLFLSGGDAPRGANLNLAAQLLMGAALLAGMFLARGKRYRAHALCQSAVVLLNLVPIASYMWPVFRRGVLPGIPASLGDPFYALPAAHAVLGGAAELLGIYVILRAGTDLLPAALRFRNYKLWMRSTLLLWWLVIGLGLTTYWVWYKAEGETPATPVARPQFPQAAPESPSARAPQTPPPAVTVTMKNFAFEPRELTVEPGAVVVWKDAAGRHSVKAEDGSFESEVLQAGGEFRHTFGREGRYPYYCTLHGSSGGHDMAGVVIVRPRAQP